VIRTVHKSYSFRTNVKGMTLLELVVVVVLIGGLLAVLSNRLIGSKSRAEYKLAQTQLSGLSQKIEHPTALAKKPPAGYSPDPVQKINK